MAEPLLVHELVSAQAKITPEQIAVVAGDRRVTYSELLEMANGLAGQLQAAGAGPETFVGVCLDRDEWLVAGLLGILQSGAAYVPLDPGYPLPRLEFIVADAGLRLIVTSTRHLPIVDALGVQAVVVDDIVATAEGVGSGVRADNPSYVVYTSGSTGTPKGVVIEHSSTANFVQWAAATATVQELSGMLAGLSVSFDVSVMEIFPPLISGGTVIVAESVLDLATLPARDEVRTVTGPPSVLRALLYRGLPAGVSTVIAAGEALTADLTAMLFAQPGVVRVRNGYGPTEATTLSHCWEADPQSAIDGEQPPIGTVVAGAVGLVLDGHGTVVADGTVGELWLAGPGLAREYLGRPELTAERFVTDPQVVGGRRYRTGDLAWTVDGVFHYVGRSDDQVKIRGFRVELGEVEEVLLGHPDVAEAIAVAPADDEGTRTLVGYVRLTAGARLNEPELRKYVAERVPSYLVPTRIGVVDSIPLNAAGKADRSALPPLRPVEAESGTPQEETQRRLAEVFATVLGVRSVGINDDFFAQGGHSLSAALAVARISEQLEKTVPLAWLLADPTVSALAARIRASSDDLPKAQRHVGQPAFPLTGMQWNLWMTPQMFPGASNTVSIELRLHGVPDAASVQAALDSIVGRHEVLRTIVAKQGDWPVALVQPPAPVPLTEIDLIDCTEEAAAEVEAQLDGAARYVFDLAGEVPLIRATLVWCAPSEARLVVVVDHFGFDGYSIGVLMEEIADGIAATVAGRSDPTPEPALQVGDIGIAQMELAQHPGLETMREFWRAELAGANSPNLPGTLREKGPVHGRRVTHRFDVDSEAALRSLEKACGATYFTVLAAALGVLLRETSGSPDNLIGASIALRDRPGVEKVIGPLVDLVPVRLAVGSDMSFRSLVAEVATRSNLARIHQDLGIAGIVQCAEPGRPPGLPLTPIVLAMQPADVPVTVERGAVRVDLVGELDSGAAMCDIAILANDTTAGREIQLMYDTERFDSDEVGNFLRRLVEILADAAADPDALLTAVPV